MKMQPLATTVQIQKEQKVKRLLGRIVVMGLLAVSCGEEPDIQVIAYEDSGSFSGVDWDDVYSQPGPSSNVYHGVTAAPTCIGNNDGIVEASEMPTVIGAVASYRVNPYNTSVPVSLTGVEDGSQYVWDYSNPPQLTPTHFKVESLQNQWFAGHFPEGQYVTPLSLWDPNILGVYRNEGDTVMLLGIASATSPADPDFTLLVYDAPLVVFRFPLDVGATWEQTVTFSDATLKGVKNAGEETYRFVVDGRGRVELPQFSFDNVLRVRLKLTQRFVVSDGSPDISHIQYFFVHECVGEVARIVSHANETDNNFTAASEFRYLGL